MSKTVKANDYPRSERMPRRKREAAPDFVFLGEPSPKAKPSRRKGV